MAKKATKKMSAVPKSLMRPRQPTQKAEKTRVKIRLRLANIRSRVAAPTKINAILTSSDGWNWMGPMETQFFAPNSRTPKRTLKASSAMEKAAAGQRNHLASSRLRSIRLMKKNTTSPSTMHTVCFAKDLGMPLAVMVRQRVVRKKAMVSISKPRRFKMRYSRYKNHMEPASTPKQGRMGGASGLPSQLFKMESL